MKDNNRIYFTILSALVLVASVFMIAINTNEAPNFWEPEDKDIVGDGEINYQLNAGEYELTRDENGFYGINMLSSDFSILDSPGDPKLPEKMYEFQVPDDIIWSTLDLKVKIGDSKVLDGTYNIAPNPPLIGWESPDSEYVFWGEKKSISEDKNMNVYGFDSNYPEESVDLIPYTERKEPTEDEFENNKYVRLVYRPFLYNPITQKLTLIEKVDIYINYECLSAPEMRGTRAGSYDYVIITTNDIVANSENLEYFVTLKEVAGHDVLVVTEDDYGVLTGQAPNDVPEKIRQWLIDNYVSMGIDYVLLIGDPDPDDPSDGGDHVGDIPMKWCMPNYFGWKSRENPTDYFYADLTGNWDLDGDEIFGECLDVTNPITPDPINVNSDYFSVRWTGFIDCDFSEEYKFHTFSDGGVRLYIDGGLEIDNWDSLSEHPPENDYATLTLSSGLHDIVLEYKEHTGDGIIKLYWQTTVPDTDPNYLGHQIIPADHMWNATGTHNGLTGEYYNNIYLSGSPALVNPKDEVINFIWGTGDLGSGGPETGAEVFVGRIPVYNDNYEEMDGILKKIIKYECEAGSLAWRETLLLPMKPLWDDTPAWHLGEGIRNDYALAAGFNCFRIYEEDYSSSGGPTPELWPTNMDNVVGEWANGYGMVVFDTHGSPTSAGDIINVDRVPELDDTKPAFVDMVACTNGHPETPNNLGYAVLEHGGITTLAATRVSYGAHGAWTFDPTSAVNHNIAYYYTKKVVDEGKPAGEALYLTKGNVAQIGANLLNYNLNGDPETYLLVTVPNVPPVADANGPYSVDEGTTAGFSGIGSYDPDTFPFPLEYRWDFENDGIWDTPWSTNPNTTYTWSDNYFGEVALEVRDGVLNDTDVTTITVNNVAPTITPFGPFSGDEPYLVDITTDASDPGSDDLTFEWVFDYGPTMTTIFYNDGMGPDPADSYIGGNYPFLVMDSASHEYGDNGNYSITLTVTDDDGGASVYTTYVIVSNVAPAIERVEAYILVNFTLRAAGEKWHNVQMSIQANGSEIAFAEVTRYPGDPDDQSITLNDVKCDVTKVIEVKIYYTPMDDPINGQINGATPVWVTMDFYDGDDVRLHHTCNVKHPDTWEWIIGANKYFVGHEITFEADASDPGSDDLKFTWFWDDSTSDTVTDYFNDGVAPDPYPSPDGVYPVFHIDIQGHVFTSNGNYNVSITVEDDDGGAAVVVITVILV